MCSHASLSSLFKTGDTGYCSFYNECILNVYIKVDMHCLYQYWFLKKDLFEGKQ